MSKRPWEWLPLPKPADYSPADEFGEDFFYKNFANPLIADTVRIMNNGLPLDIKKVFKLEKEVSKVLQSVETTIEVNPIIQQYYQWKYPSLLKEHNALYQEKIHTYEQHLTDFKPKDVIHRSHYIFNYIAANPRTAYDIIPPPDITETGVPKWTANQLKRIIHAHPKLEALSQNSESCINDKYAQQAVKDIAQFKADKFNERHDYINRQAANSIKDLVPTFNPASSNQLHELLTNMLGHESDELSDAFKEWQKQVQRNARYGTPIEKETPKNKYSWSRDEVEKLQQLTEEGSDLHILLQAFIDHSFAAIIKQNFIESFYTYTVNDRLYGQYKLLGAKSG